MHLLRAALLGLCGFLCLGYVVYRLEHRFWWTTVRHRPSDDSSFHLFKMLTVEVGKPSLVPHPQTGTSIVRVMPPTQIPQMLQTSDIPQPGHPPLLSILKLEPSDESIINRDGLSSMPAVAQYIMAALLCIWGCVIGWKVRMAQVGQWSEYKADVPVEWCIAATSEDVEQRNREGALEPKPEIPIQAYLTLAALLAIYVSNQWSRQLINYIVNFSSTDAYVHINAALDISREQYALLSGAGFTVFYAAMSLVAGSLADRSDRKSVAVGSALVWSVATACQALCTSFSGLAVLRAIQGFSQAFCTPAAYTLISESFPQSSRASMNGIYGSAIYLGGALASLGILLDVQYGWRNTTILIGGFGVLAALAGAAFIQPPAKAKEVISLETRAVDSEEVGTLEVVTNVFRNVWNDAGDVLKRRNAQLIFLAAAFRFCAGFSIGIWKAPFIFEKFPELAGSFSAINAGVISIGGLLSSLIGGFLADRFFQGRRKLFVPAIGSLLAVPTFALFVTQPDFNTALLWLFVEYLVAECWFGPTLAALYDSVPSNKRGSAQGLFSTLTAIGTIAPVIIGTLASQPGNSVGNALLEVVGITYFISSLLFAAAALSAEETQD